ncbi:hypothetical protein DSO57_1015513 [Entomophthora muscae]|uniref:Uncharacterized protein n=1 Tax=Entomophthora muscae TaxID=34485 RepID=A0ACC2URS6_9FUNG|nr:hypothetical protein DSO57_1015513 [Entomophthora muscae]
METPTAAETTSTQLFGVLYINLTGMVDFMVPTSRPWSLLGQSMSYIFKLDPLYGGLYLPARSNLIPSRPMPLPMPGFLTRFLTSRQPPSRQPRPCRPPARLLPGSQGPPCNQSKNPLGYSQSNKSLKTRAKSETKISPSEERKNNDSEFKNKFATNQLGAKLQTT